MPGAPATRSTRAAGVDETLAEFDRAAGAGPPAHDPPQRLALGAGIARGPARAHRRRDGSGQPDSGGSWSTRRSTTSPTTSRPRAWRPASTRSTSRRALDLAAGRPLAPTSRRGVRDPEPRAHAPRRRTTRRRSRMRRRRRRSPLAATTVPGYAVADDSERRRPLRATAGVRPATAASLRGAPPGCRAGGPSWSWSAPCCWPPSPASRAWTSAGGGTPTRATTCWCSGALVTRRRDPAAGSADVDRDVPPRRRLLLPPGARGARVRRGPRRGDGLDRPVRDRARSPRPGGWPARRRAAGGAAGRAARGRVAGRHRRVHVHLEPEPDPAGGRPRLCAA